MSVIATLYDPKTGECAVYVDDHSDSDIAVYLWTEGNFSCDCNRRDFIGYTLHPDTYHAPACNENCCGEEVILESLVDENGRNLLS